MAKRSSPSVLQHRRSELEARIEKMIELLDLIDGDPDLEPYLADSRTDLEEDNSDFELNGDEQDTGFTEDEGGCMVFR